MPDHKELLDRLDRYAKACARNSLRKFDLGHDWHRSEDIAQVLFPAGWQVCKARGDEGLAKHRISSRAKNEAERLRAELKNEPQPVPDLTGGRIVSHATLPRWVERVESRGARAIWAYLLAAALAAMLAEWATTRIVSHRNA